MRENYVKHLKLKSIFERENTFHFENSHSVLIGIDEFKGVSNVTTKKNITMELFVFVHLPQRY